MTTTEKKRRIEEIEKITHEIIREKVVLQLEVEEDEGRHESYRALWCRAWLAGDMPECDRLLALEYPEVTP